MSNEQLINKLVSIIFSRNRLDFVWFKIFVLCIHLKLWIVNWKRSLSSPAYLFLRPRRREGDNNVFQQPTDIKDQKASATFKINKEKCAIRVEIGDEDDGAKVARCCCHTYPTQYCYGIILTNHYCVWISSMMISFWCWFSRDDECVNKLENTHWLGGDRDCWWTFLESMDCKSPAQFCALAGAVHRRRASRPLSRRDRRDFGSRTQYCPVGRRRYQVIIKFVAINIRWSELQRYSSRNSMSIKFEGRVLKQ